ncbi:MAG: DNA polymerase III subunit beta [Clostridiales bacterium]|nr:DNA polymerase III subunit beta [Clostridiales bacterium]
MKFICDGLDLSDAVLKVSKALSIKAANPILEGIKLTAKGDTLTLLATDLELTIEKQIKADVLMEGETVVVGKYFVDFTKKLEKEQVELSRLFDGGLQIKYSESESEFQVFPAENFPNIYKTNQGVNFEIKAKDFKEIVERTIFACASDDARPILKGCLFDINDNLLSAVALDGFRMAVVKKEVISSGDMKVVIPSRALNEITRLIEKEDELLKVYIQDNSLFVQIGNTSIASRLIEGEFVKYNHILPNSFENSVTVNRQALLTSLERAGVVARDDRYNVVKLDVKENVMTVYAKSEIGEVNENVNILLKGKDMTIAFNGKYLSEYLKIVNDEFLLLNLNSSIDPCVITAMNSQNYIYLVLPVRINS